MSIGKIKPGHPRKQEWPQLPSSSSYTQFLGQPQASYATEHHPPSINVLIPTTPMLESPPINFTAPRILEKKASSDVLSNFPADSLKCVPKCRPDWGLGFSSPSSGFFPTSSKWVRVVTPLISSSASWSLTPKRRSTWVRPPLLLLKPFIICWRTPYRRTLHPCSDTRKVPTTPRTPSRLPSPSLVSSPTLTQNETAFTRNSASRVPTLTTSTVIASASGRPCPRVFRPNHFEQVSQEDLPHPPCLISLGRREKLHPTDHLLRSRSR